MSHFRELSLATDTASSDHDLLFNTSTVSPDPQQSSRQPACSPTRSERNFAAADPGDPTPAPVGGAWTGDGERGASASAAGRCWDHLADADRSLWPDAWLVAAVREDLPDPAALNVLALRFGPLLWRRCLRLTGNGDKAGDLAQETWLRLLRCRRSLRPEKNFRAYLTTVATNLWRDKFRAARRAGDMAESRLVALDAAGAGSEGETFPTYNANAADRRGMFTLAEVVPDAHDVEIRARRLLIEELQHVLACLSPLHRDVLLARFLRGESCALIGVRYARTEQAVSRWVREALGQARGHWEAMNPTVRRR